MVGISAYFFVDWFIHLCGAARCNESKRDEKRFGAQNRHSAHLTRVSAVSGAIQHENLQLEETVFYALLFLSTGIFTRVLIHYAVAKIAGPFIWGRGFCGWACWTVAVLDWLPIKENNSIPAKYGKCRYLSLGVSLAIPVLFIALGYDFVGQHLQGNEDGIFQTAKQGQLIWFLVGNGIYYALSIPMAFLFKKKRAFCKILCPVSLVMKAQSTVALIRRRPTENECVACGICNKNCPMDVDIVGYIKNKKSITSGECIQCCICVNGCPQNAIK